MVLDLGFWVAGFVFRVWDLDFPLGEVSGSGLGVQELGLQALDLALPKLTEAKNVTERLL